MTVGDRRWKLAELVDALVADDKGSVADVVQRGPTDTATGVASCLSRPQRHHGPQARAEHKHRTQCLVPALGPPQLEVRAARSCPRARRRSIDVSCQVLRFSRPPVLGSDSALGLELREVAEFE